MSICDHIVEKGAWVLGLGEKKMCLYFCKFVLLVLICFLNIDPWNTDPEGIHTKTKGILPHSVRIAI